MFFICTSILGYTSKEKNTKNLLSLRYINFFSYLKNLIHKFQVFKSLCLILSSKLKLSIPVPINL